MIERFDVFANNMTGTIGSENEGQFSAVSFFFIRGVTTIMLISLILEHPSKRSLWLGRMFYKLASTGVSLVSSRVIVAVYYRGVFV